MPEVLMPRLSDSMEEGIVLRWLVGDGEEVRRGDEIVEIETDKATMPYEAEADGVLHHVAAEGDTVPLGAVIATIGEPDAPAAGSNGGARAATAVATAPARTAAAAPRAPKDGVSASPVARRLAAALGVALSDVQGTGPRGRILKADVRAAAERSAPAAAPPTAAPAPAPAAASAAAPAAAPPAGDGRGEATVHQLSRLQQTVARRMVESKATAPDFEASVDVDMTAMLELRRELKELGDPAPSVNDLLVKAVATTLRRHPRVNGAYRDGRFETYARVNVGIAVAADDALVVPVIHDADRLSLGEIARTSRALAERVRSNAMTPGDLDGGTFTISNLGMFGVDRFSGVINMPQSAILCAGATTRRPVVGPDDRIVARDVMTLTLVSDHRIIYGADAARFLADLRAALERPLATAL